MAGCILEGHQDKQNWASGSLLADPTISKSSYYKKIWEFSRFVFTVNVQLAIFIGSMASYILSIESAEHVAYVYNTNKLVISKNYSLYNFQAEMIGSKL